MYQINTLYSLNLCNVKCQLYLNESGKYIDKSIMWIPGYECCDIVVQTEESARYLDFILHS